MAKDKLVRVDIRFYDYVKKKGYKMPEFTRRLLPELDEWDFNNKKPKNPNTSGWGFRI